MEKQIKNSHHRDLDLARDKESSIWALKLTKALRNNMELGSTYLLEPQLEGNQVKKLPSPFFAFFKNFEQYLPWANNGISEGGRRVVKSGL